MSGYVRVGGYLREANRWGGVGWFVENGVTHKPISDFDEVGQDMDCEVAAIEVTRGTEGKYLLIGVYRSPNGNPDSFLTRFNDILHSASRKWRKFIVCGDMNIDLLSHSRLVTDYKNLLACYGLECLVRDPTRVTSASSTLIDHVLTNFSCESATVINTSLSDHYGQFLHVGGGKIQGALGPKWEMKRVFSTRAVESFLGQLEACDWPGVLRDGNVLGKTTRFMSLVSHHLDLAAPIKRVKVKGGCRADYNWFTRELAEQREGLLTMSTLARSSDAEEVRGRYRRQRAAYRKALREAKAKACSDKLAKAENCSRAIWNIVNDHRRGGSRGAGGQDLRLELDGGRVLSDPVEVASAFCQQFTLSSSLPQTSDQTGQGYVSVSQSMFLYHTTGAEIRQILQGFQPKWSCGPDDIPVAVLKKCGDSFCEAMSELVNASFDDGLFPSEFKIAKVVPVHKKGCKSDLSNYRPISLLSCFSKVLEVAMAKRLTSFWARFGVFSNGQHGFRKGRSTSTAIIQFLAEIYDAFESGEYAAGVFMDLSKAFDRVEHSVLLDKLYRRGIRGQAWNWIKSYLADRKQYVQVKGGKSDTTGVSVGVPQGSVLGPLLFLVYVDDMGYFLRGKLIQFADDSNDIVCGKDIAELETAVSVDMDMIQQWLVSNSLTCNYSKTNYMLFKMVNKPDIDVNVRMGDAQIDRVTEVKFLGVTIDEHLTWSSHIDVCCKRLSSAIFGLRTLAWECGRNREALLIVYHGLFMSTARYGILAWGAAAESHINRVLILQKEAVRIIANLGWHESCRESFKQLKLFTIPSAYIFDSILYCLENGNPVLVSDVTGRATRQRADLYLSPRRIHKPDSHVLRQGRILFNALPSELKAKRDDLKVFKRLLKVHLLEGAFYSLQEFKGVSGGLG